MNDRRDFLASTGAAALAALASTASTAAAQPKSALIKPPRLKAGDALGLIHPSSATFQRMELEIAIDNLKALGFKVKVGAHALDRYGYLAGRDVDRAADINTLFADKDVQGICAVRGGWGAARLLPYLNFDVIAKTPRSSSASPTSPRCTWPSPRRPAS